jgi:acyl-CoA dehydrogenase
LMACEGVRLAPDYRRLALSHLVLRHKLLPVDPLVLQAVRDEAGILDALVKAREISQQDAMQLLPIGSAK